MVKINTVEQYAFAVGIVERHVDAAPFSPAANIIEEIIDECIEFEKEFFKAD